MFRDLSFRMLYNLVYNFIVLNTRKHPILKPLFFSIYLTKLCNFSCAFCDFARTGEVKTNHTQLTTEEMIRILRIIRRESTAVYFTGGEPMMRKDIVDILRAAKEMGFKTIGINTNMSLIHLRPDVLMYVSNLVCSLHMIGGKEYAEILGISDKVLKQVMENIIHCATQQKRFGFRMTVNCVVTPQTIKQTREVMDLCFCNDIRFAIVPAELDHGAINQALLKSPEYRELIRDVKAQKRAGSPVFGSFRYLDTIEVFKPFNCYPTLIPHVMENGNLVYPCQPIGTMAANLLETGDYWRALHLGIKKYGNLPMCKNICHKACYIEPPAFVKAPWLLLKEL